jgi:predicted peroxiredoxin
MLKKLALLIALLFTTVYADVKESKESNSTQQKKRKKTLSNKKLVVFVNSGNLQQAGMGFGIALSGTKQGADVTIVIGANAIQYALKENSQNIYFSKNKTPKQLIIDAIKSGATVQLCSANTDEMGLDEDDFIEGTSIVISTQIFAKVFEEGTRVISF